MLKQRVITALILAILVIWGVLALPSAWFGGFLILIIMLSAWEWTKLMGLSKIGIRVAYCGLVLGLIGLGWQLQRNSIFLWIILIFAGLYWCYVLIWLQRYTANPTARNSLLTWILSGCVILVAPWIALMTLRNESNFGPYYVLFLLMLIWIADIGAYFVGRRWGRRKLAPVISPGKTWEGAAGAIIAAMFFSLIGIILFGLSVVHGLLFVCLCLLTVAFSIVGDLFESMGKRQHGVKDSGSILPGHGGILDRVDSLTAAAPVFVLGLQWLVQ